MGTGDNNRPVTVADLRKLREGIRGDIQTSVRTIRQGLQETPPPVATTNIDISTPDRTELFPQPKKERIDVECQDVSGQLSPADSCLSPDDLAGEREPCS